MQILERLNFTLYASMGTADFYTEHGIKVILHVATMLCSLLQHLPVLRLRQWSGRLKTTGMGMERSTGIVHSRTLLTTCVSGRSV